MQIDVYVDIAKSSSKVQVKSVFCCIFVLSYNGVEFK